MEYILTNTLLALLELAILLVQRLEEAFRRMEAKLDRMVEREQIGPRRFDK